MKSVAYSENYLRTDVPPAHIDNFLKAFDIGVPLMNHPESSRMQEKFNQMWPSVLTGELDISIQELCDQCNEEAQRILDEWNAKNRS